jgi:hypothetical protein
LTVQKVSSLIGRYLIGLEAPNPVNLRIRFNERQDIRDGVLESEKFGGNASWLIA